MPYKEVPVSILIYKQRHRHPNYKKTPKGNYAHIGYIATRPGAVKNEGCLLYTSLAGDFIELLVKRNNKTHNEPKL